MRFSESHAKSERIPKFPSVPYSLFPIPCSLFPKKNAIANIFFGEFYFGCLTRWCVTGRTIPRLAKKQKIRASPPLTHPTQLFSILIFNS
ncbi:hypothetical protein [Moorena sp. SIO3I6]|uniref:hypothetical protein n=1 Tax=Moorena sp. SIO3I6 TaxID=2607831 RepID=UPI0013FB0310|nr:hypothetical protein [Moorena sp. SIO3I6]NEP28334.1 hypothetical protein [Moorena sp. SIO3I6]